MPADGGIEAFLRGTLAKTGWSDPIINGLLADLQPYLDRVRDARGDDEAAQLREEVERYKRLVARYRKPMPDGGFNWQERAHTAHVRACDAEAELERLRAINAELVEAHNTLLVEAARSPQGEDHETARPEQPPPDALGGQPPAEPPENP